MYLTRHRTDGGPRWAVDGRFLPPLFNLGELLEREAQAIDEWLRRIVIEEPASAPMLAPLESMHEVWASGVTYERSREARRAESDMGDVYDRVYVAERPELFFKAIGWRVVGPGAPIRIRADSRWNVPEPELVLVLNSRRAVVGFCAGNDVSSRSIEGENPLYLPQAKIYAGACALGPGIQLGDADALRDMPIQIEIERQGQAVFHGETRTSRMNRRFEDLVGYLGRELDFAQGVFLMTGTGIVPPDDFSLGIGDRVTITLGSMTLENEVGA
ncbi:MAG TPA: fumarylacetoacetate hydrolase family protein [Anaerolineae bacterium]|nr:fumarylacetoacetate hydrolase family protein [Anaerolineae bacterium]